MKKIAVDLDGVVFDSETLYRVFTEIYDVETFVRDSVNNNSEKTFQKRYSWCLEVGKEFYDKYSKDILSNCNIMPGADIVLDKLKSNYDIIIVTARRSDEISITERRLKKLNLENVKVFYNKKDKIQTLLNEKVDYIIDDDLNICRNASMKSINALFFKNSAMPFVSETEYFRIVNNWGEIYKYFMLK